MIGKSENIDSKTEESEERNVAKDKMVESSGFHPEGAGSLPAGNTKEEHFKRDFVNCNWNNIGVKTDTIDGRAFSRLSVLQL